MWHVELASLNCAAIVCLERPSYILAIPRRKAVQQFLVFIVTGCPSTADVGVQRGWTHEAEGHVSQWYVVSLQQAGDVTAGAMQPSVLNKF